MITKTNIRYFDLAKSISQFSDYNRYHIGCVVIYKSHILSVGFNTNKTHPIQMEYNRHRKFNNPDNVLHKLHAEVSALLKIQDLNIDWNKVEIYIYREHRNGIKALSAPCKGCIEFIRDKGISNLYYTGEDSYIYERIG